MNTKQEGELLARVRRLERLTLLDFLERHGLKLQVGTNVGKLRAECARDATAIAQELSEPPLETRRERAA